MAKALVTDYVFDPINRQITINGFGNTPSKYGLTSVRNTRTGDTYYLQDQVNQISVSGKVFTLPTGVINTPARSTDSLDIYFDDTLTGPHVDGDGKEIAPPQAVGAAATDAASALTLVNDIRAKLIAAGILSP